MRKFCLPSDKSGQTTGGYRRRILCWNLTDFSRIKLCGEQAEGIVEDENKRE